MDSCRTKEKPHVQKVFFFFLWHYFWRKMLANVLYLPWKVLKFHLDCLHGLIWMLACALTSTNQSCNDIQLLVLTNLYWLSNHIEYHIGLAPMSVNGILVGVVAEKHNSLVTSNLGYWRTILSCSFDMHTITNLFTNMSERHTHCCHFYWTLEFWFGMNLPTTSKQKWRRWLLPSTHFM